VSPRTTPPDRSPAETTTYLEIPPAPDVRDPSESATGAVEPERVSGEQTEPTQTEPTQTEPTQTEPTQTEPTQTEPSRVEPARVADPGPSTAVLDPLAIPPAPATIPALPLAPRDPADRPFADPRRSAPGKPNALWRRLFRRRR